MVGCLGRTIEGRGDERSGEISLLVEVQMVWDLWSIRVVRPRLVLHVPHDPDVYEGGLRRRAESKLGREFLVEKDLGAIKSQERPTQRWRAVGVG